MKRPQWRRLEHSREDCMTPLEIFFNRNVDERKTSSERWNEGVDQRTAHDSRRPLHLSNTLLVVFGNTAAGNIVDNSTGLLLVTDDITGVRTWIFSRTA